MGLGREGWCCRESAVRVVFERGFYFIALCKRIITINKRDYSRGFINTKDKA